LISTDAIMPEQIYANRAVDNRERSKVLSSAIEAIHSASRELIDMNPNAQASG
jgi:hypothetical protein